jgi:hypothetical protein
VLRAHTDLADVARARAHGTSTSSPPSNSLPVSASPLTDRIPPAAPSSDQAVPRRAGRVMSMLDAFFKGGAGGGFRGAKW